MNGFPGPRPIYGDAAHITIGTDLLICAGKISVRGFVQEGQGYAELVLPDADPQQRRDLERVRRYRFEPYLDSGELCSSPEPTIRDTQRDGNGALAVAGCP